MLSLVFGEPSPARSMSNAARADTILIVKHERKLYLLQDDYPLRIYRIALGLSPTGAKEHQWDFRTPEGSYVIDFRQEHSHYFKALHISYPSAGGSEAILHAALCVPAEISSFTESPIDPPSRSPITKLAIGPTVALLSPMRTCRTCGI